MSLRHGRCRVEEPTSRVRLCRRVRRPEETKAGGALVACDRAEDRSHGLQSRPIVAVDVQGRR